MATKDEPQTIRNAEMITALKNKIDRLADESMTRFDEMDTDKIIECQRHLSFIPALTVEDIHSKLYICTMMGLCESELACDYLDAWATNNIAFINVTNDEALLQLKKDASQMSVNDDEWNSLYCSVVTDIKKFLAEELHK